MNARNNEATEEPVSGSHSRFAYHNELEPVEGGVRAVAEKPKDGKASASKGERKPGPHGGRQTNGMGATTTGLPGPEDRLLDISEIARSVGMHYTHKFAISHREGDELDTDGPITGEVTLTNGGEALILRGHAKTNLKMECSRCLNLTVQPIETDIEEEFDLVSSHSAWSNDDIVEAVDEDQTGSVIQGNILDLGDLLRQSILLAAPVQPLCREDCPGIDLSAHGGEFRVSVEEEPVEEEPVPDNPLRHLAELLEAKRREENGE